MFALLIDCMCKYLYLKYVFFINLFLFIFTERSVKLVNLQFRTAAKAAEETEKPIVPKKSRKRRHRDDDNNEKKVVSHKSLPSATQRSNNVAAAAALKRQSGAQIVPIVSVQIKGTIKSLNSVAQNSSRFNKKKKFIEKNNLILN